MRGLSQRAKEVGARHFGLEHFVTRTRSSTRTLSHAGTRASEDSLAPGPPRLEKARSQRRAVGNGACVRRHPVPERGRDDRRVRHCARAALDENGLEGEVIVVDNGSTDGSGALAGCRRSRRRGASAGYGSAYLAGIGAAQRRLHRHDRCRPHVRLRRDPELRARARGGRGVRYRNRMRGVQPGAMPLAESGRQPDPDRLPQRAASLEHARRPLRNARAPQDILPILDLRTVGMEFASEMVIRAMREHLDIRELPIKLHPRAGTSKLSPFRDGWRHLRLIARLQPDVPLPHPGGRDVRRRLPHHADGVRSGADLRPRSLDPFADRRLACSSSSASQAVGLGLCARVFGVYFISEQDQLLQKLGARFKLEHGLAARRFLLAGLDRALAVVFGQWARTASGR